MLIGGHGNRAKKKDAAQDNSIEKGEIRRHHWQLLRPPNPNLPGRSRSLRLGREITGSDTELFVFRIFLRWISALRVEKDRERLRSGGRAITLVEERM